MLFPINLVHRNDFDENVFEAWLLEISQNLIVVQVLILNIYFICFPFPGCPGSYCWISIQNNRLPCCPFFWKPLLVSSNIPSTEPSIQLTPYCWVCFYPISKSVVILRYYPYHNSTFDILLRVSYTGLFSKVYGTHFL